jgi:DNA (cytosine-5)-methyltransferase 1
VNPAVAAAAAAIEARHAAGRGRVTAQPVPARQGWVLRNNTSAHAAIRGLGEPAPTMFFGARINTMAWTRDGAAVRITVAEAACFQSFPPGHPWQGTESEQFTQAGNAVPPLLAAAVLASVLPARLG